MRAIATTLTLALLAASAAAASPPNATCVAICTAPVSEPAPICPQCDGIGSCDRVYTDRPAFQKCYGEQVTCGQEEYACAEGLTTGGRARDVCVASGSSPRSRWRSRR